MPSPAVPETLVAPPEPVTPRDAGAALDELVAWAAASAVPPDADRKLTPSDVAALIATPPVGPFTRSIAAVAPAAFFDYPTLRK
ncbi:MAG: hypothetical protein ACRC7O_04810, partial [Fimbriiglobus sp.]